jgi:hypothetical protein
VAVLIEKIIIKIRIKRLSKGKDLLHAPCFNVENLRAIFLCEALENGPLVNCKVKNLELNLGVIPEVKLSSRFKNLLKQEWMQFLAQYKVRPLEGITSLVEPSIPLLRKLDFPQDKSAMLYFFALHCMQINTMHTPIRHDQSVEYQLLLRKLLQASPHCTVVPPFFYQRVTVARLTIAALVYLVGDERGAHWLSQHSLNHEQLTMLSDAICHNEIPVVLVVALIDDFLKSASFCQRDKIIRYWLIPLWQRKNVRNVIKRQSDKAAIVRIDMYFSTIESRYEKQRGKQYRQQSLPVSNAGLVLLWPLLPSLLTLLGCCQDGQFVDERARYLAAEILDWLVWQEILPKEQRMSVNHLLCGIPIDKPAPKVLSLNEQQKIQIDDWFNDIFHQIFCWKALTPLDIRALFLQRPGNIYDELSSPQLNVKPEPFDVLLRDWPWPTTLATFSWLEQPLSVIWPMNWQGNA